MKNLLSRSFKWLGMKGSNLQPSGSEPDTLPIAPIPNIKAFKSANYTYTALFVSIPQVPLSFVHLLWRGCGGRIRTYGAGFKVPKLDHLPTPQCAFPIFGKNGKIWKFARHL